MKISISDSRTQAIEARYQRLVPRIQQLPPPGSRPLTVAGKVAGWITARATAVLADQPGFSVEPEAVNVTASARSGLSLNEVLASAAFVMRDAGCLRGWRDELLDVIGEGRQLGVVERAALRPLGLLTRAVHLNAWTPDGRLWIAKRAATKTTDPNMWDTLVGGLACAGELLDDSLLRESHEEAGLEPVQLESRSPLRTILRMHRRLPEGYQVEDVLISECVLDDGVIPCNLDGEVSEILAVSLDELWERVCAKEFTVEAELVILDSLLHRSRAGHPELGH